MANKKWLRRELVLKVNATAERAFVHSFKGNGLKAPPRDGTERSLFIATRCGSYQILPGTGEPEPMMSMKSSSQKGCSPLVTDLNIHVTEAPDWNQYPH